MAGLYLSIFLPFELRPVGLAMKKNIPMFQPLEP